MARGAKSLLERVLEGSFVPSRDEGLLARQLLPVESPFQDARRRQVWEELRALQLAYQTAWDVRDDVRSLEVWRAHRVSEFSRAVRRLHGSLGYRWERAE